jgi:hypothetical protein
MQNLLSKHLTVFLGGIILCLCGGCGGGTADAPELAEVRGVVKLEGKPLEGATVTFMPTEGRPSAGLTNAAGEYELMYTMEEPGAKLGKHTVTITTERARSGGEGDQPLIEARKELLPNIYHSNTTLSETVEAGENVIDFDLKAEAPSA